MPDTADVDVQACNWLKFIPGREKEWDFKDQLLATPPSQCDGIPVRKVDYEVVYVYDPAMNDYCRCYFENGVQVAVPGDDKNRHFRPREGKDLYFRLIGFHPYEDSLGIQLTFKNRNEEYGPQFLGTALSGFPDLGAKPEQQVTEQGKTKGQSLAASSVAEFISAFRDEMKLFYEQKKTDRYLSLPFLEKCVAYIRSQVRGQFNISDASPEAVLRQGNVLIETIADAAERKKIRAVLQEGVDWYRRILSYQTQRFLEPVQVKNADVTDLKFQWYRGGKPKQHSEATYFNKGGFKIDFSTGLVGHLLEEHRFTTVPKDTLIKGTPPDTDKIETRGRIVREKTSRFGVDAGVFAHFYTRNSCFRRFNLSGSFGVIPTKQNDQFRMRYLAGLSALFGSAQRIVLTVGGIGGRVARLAEGLKAGDDGTLLQLSAGQPVVVPTRDLFCGSFFVAVTFNFATVSPGNKS